jgi:hypothetical protein
VVIKSINRSSMSCPCAKLVPSRVNRYYKTARVLSAKALVVAHPVLLLFMRSRGRASSERIAHPVLVRARRKFRSTTPKRFCNSG